MLTRIFWIPDVKPHRLAMMPRPHGGEDLQYEVEGWKAEGITTIVSLLEPFEASHLDLDEEGALCRAAGIDFVSFPIGDRGLPSSVAETRELVNDVVERLRGGGTVAIHCRVGIGRTGLISACTLLHLGISKLDVFPALIRARGIDVPDTLEQRKWVEEYAKCLT